MAAILGAALGVLAMGLATFISAAALGAKEWFEFQKRVGPLSGKTTMACIAWLLAWGVLQVVWWKRDVPFLPVAILSAALMLENVGLEEEAKAIERAVRQAVAARLGTEDVGGTLGTRETGDHIAGAIRAQKAWS